jgi:hypothetical protein
MSDWRSERKIVAMPGVESATPEVILARTLEKARAGHIRGVVVGIVWNDGSVGSDHSALKMGDALFALHIARRDLDAYIVDVDPDEFRED